MHWQGLLLHILLHIMILTSYQKQPFRACTILTKNAQPVPLGKSQRLIAVFALKL